MWYYYFELLFEINDIIQDYNLLLVDNIYIYCFDKYLYNLELLESLYNFFCFEGFPTKLKYSTEIPIDIYFNFIEKDVFLFFVNYETSPILDAELYLNMDKILIISDNFEYFIYGYNYFYSINLSIYLWFLDL
jgi:hypothetical protein